MKFLFKKIKMPAFFKTKKFFILLSIFVLFFLFAPISLHQIGNRVESFLNERAEYGVQAFEKQTGLQIKWKLLNFNIFLMTVNLEKVQIIPLYNSNFKKIQELNFLDGLQKVERISARPSLYSLLFERKIVLSKLHIKAGGVFLKTLKFVPKQRNSPQRIDLPIKKIVIEDADLTLRHKDHILRLSKVQSKILQRKSGAFRFHLFVDELKIKKDKGFAGFQILNKKAEMQKEQSFQLSFRGAAKKDKVVFEEINLKNKKFRSLTSRLEIDFKNSRAERILVKSSGGLPSYLIQKGFDLMGRELFPFSGLLSYKLNAEYKNQKGWRGSFQVRSRDAVFKNVSMSNFSINGRLLNYLLTVDSGLMEIENQGKAHIKKGEWLFKGEPSQFNFSIEAEKLSSQFAAQTILDFKSTPAAGDFTGLIQCLGADSGSYVKCSMEGSSSAIHITGGAQENIASIYGMDFTAEIEWQRGLLVFKAAGQKDLSSKIDLQGKYFEDSDKMEAVYSFTGKLFEDLKFHTPFPLKGGVDVKNGKLFLDRNSINIEGAVFSSDLEVDNYKLNNIAAVYRLKNNELEFLDIKGTPNKTNYTAGCKIDFKKETFALNLKFSFIDLEDLTKSIEKNLPPPFQIKGTGAASFYMYFPWADPDKKEFELKGNLFNVSINKDLFQQVDFDLSLQDQKGVVQSLFFRKGQGSIRGTGFFDHKYNLDLSFIGQNLSLERMEWLNEALPFNQSGGVNFSLEAGGSLFQPKITGSAEILNMLLYSYSFEDSQLEFEADRSSLSFSGNIANQIRVKRFVYSFSKRDLNVFEGDFVNLDFVKTLSSKFRTDKEEDYSSKITGSFSFLKKTSANRLWTGSAQINNLFISKSEEWIESRRPFSIFVKKGKWSLSEAQFMRSKNRKLNIKKIGKDELKISGGFSLGLFSVFFPFFEKIDGNIKADILIKNDLKKMFPRGSVNLAQGVLSIYSLPDFTNIRSSFVFSKNNIFINDLKASAGEGSLNGGGSVLYDFVDYPKLDFGFNFSNARLNIPKDFHTRGSGRIEIKGVQPPYTIAGIYNIDSGDITKDFSGGAGGKEYSFAFLNKEKQKQPSVFVLDLDIKANNPVDVNSSFIRSAVEGRANVYGPFESLLIDGEFTLPKRSKENLIFFRGQEFKINSGSILFKKSAPENPYLDVKADTLFKETLVDPQQSAQEIERSYKIFLSLKGPSKQPNFSLKSSPPLNEKEIISLLTLGIGSRRFDSNVKQSVTDYSYQILASLLLEKPLNKEINSLLGVDFRLTPYINTLNKPVTKITVSKNWFDKWKTSFSRTIDEEPQSDIRLKYNLNQKISLTAFWENVEEIRLEENQNDKLGLDFEFNFDF